MTETTLEESDSEDAARSAAAAASLQLRIAGHFPESFGMRFLSATSELVEAELMLRDGHTRSAGVMHGGVVMAFADTLGGAVNIMNVAPDVEWTTIESKTSFISPGLVGTRLLGKCAPLHRVRRTLVLQTHVTCAEDGRLVAVVTQTHLVMERTPPSEQIAKVCPPTNELSRHDWL